MKNHTELPRFQSIVAEFVAEHHLSIDVPSRLLDLVSEIGELAKELLKETGYGQRLFVPSTAWREELADMLFALVCVANSTQVDLQQELLAALAKYRRRLEQSGNAGSAGSG